jgi:hypothetical protein
VTSILRAVAEFAAFCKKADVVGEPRISISFDNPRDAAYFEREVSRELAGQLHMYPQPMSANEFRMYGVHLRIME